VLKREVNFFFPSPADCQIQKDHNQNELSADVDAKWEAEHKENLLRLLKAYNLIAQAKVREQILLLVETLSKEHNSNNVN
jgi:predicted transposase YbfD/YdcC